MRLCIEQSNDLAPLPLFPSWLDCTTNTSGYDFRKGHGQPTDRILPSRRLSELITPVPQPKNAARSAARRRWSSTKARVFRPKRSSTILPRSSTTSALTSMAGGACRIRTIGRSRPRRRGYSSTGANKPSKPAAFFLSGRSNRDDHLADRGRAKARQTRRKILAAHQRRQRTG
jgi:hypothetical protein